MAVDGPRCGGAGQATRRTSYCSPGRCCCLAIEHSRAEGRSARRTLSLRRSVVHSLRSTVLERYLLGSVWSNHVRVPARELNRGLFGVVIY